MAELAELITLLVGVSVSLGMIIGGLLGYIIGKNSERERQERQKRNTQKT